MAQRIISGDVFQESLVELDAEIVAAENNQSTQTRNTLEVPTEVPHQEL